jgi:hypothetical protein
MKRSGPSGSRKPADGRRCPIHKERNMVYELSRAYCTSTYMADMGRGIRTPTPLLHTTMRAAHQKEPMPHVAAPLGHRTGCHHPRIPGRTKQNKTREMALRESRSGTRALEYTTPPSSSASLVTLSTHGLFAHLCQQRLEEERSSVQRWRQISRIQRQEIRRVH